MNASRWKQQALIALAALWAMAPRAANARPANDTARRCQALTQADFSATRDAPFTAISAEIVTGGPALPYCRVEGYVAPEISFEIR